MCSQVNSIINMQLNIFLKNISDIEQIWKKVHVCWQSCWRLCFLFVVQKNCDNNLFAFCTAPGDGTLSQNLSESDSISFFCTRHILYCIMYIVATAPFVYAVIQITVGTVLSVQYIRVDQIFRLSCLRWHVLGWVKKRLRSYSNFFKCAVVYHRSAKVFKSA